MLRPNKYTTLLLLLQLFSCRGFQVTTSKPQSTSSTTNARKKILSTRKHFEWYHLPRGRHHNDRFLTLLFFHDRQADIMEQFVGGMRYEMVELPDSLVDTTIFVGNLCEFVTDEMLSALFQQASSLNFVPACVARKPDSSSLKYGFVTFPTVEEKEAAIIRFTGYVLNEKPIRVESIIDYKYRVRVPEKLVFYTVGEAKKTRDGTRNHLRMAQNSREQGRATRQNHKSRVKKNARPGSKSLIDNSHAHVYERNKGKRNKRFQRERNRSIGGHGADLNS